MIYGLYLSATGVLANSLRQDVIANNIANAETTGFKRDLATFQELRTSAQRNHTPAKTNSALEPLGGGMCLIPSPPDMTPGELEPTGNKMDVAIQGTGYFAVRNRGQIMLSRDGRFAVNPAGHLTLASEGQEVLDEARNPITVDPNQQVIIARDGSISQNGSMVGRLGVFDVANPESLRKYGQSLLTCPDADRALRPSDSAVSQGYVERANVDPATELAALMDAQRQLEANANMIRYQDQTLSRLVNDVGKIG